MFDSIIGSDVSGISSRLSVAVSSAYVTADGTGSSPMAILAEAQLEISKTRAIKLKLINATIVRLQLYILFPPAGTFQPAWQTGMDWKKAMAFPLIKV